MMTRNSALEKFLLSRKFIVCIIVLQFILLPIATKGFRWENIGDLIIYTLSHALIQGMYPYAWTFQIVSLVMLMLLVLRRVTMSRWFMFYVGGCYVLYAIVQNVAVTDKYGFSIVTVNVVMMLLVALLWMREAWRGSSMLTFGNLNRRTAWLIPVALFCLWWPMDMMRGAEPDFSPIHLFAGGSAMAFCPMTPVFLVLLLLSKENIDLTPEAAMLISRIADGALRDALSLLDRCASYGTEITEKVASDAAGIAGREHLFELVDAVISHDSPRALTIIDELYNNSCDMERLLSELLSHFRNMMVALTVPNFRELVICPDSEIEIIRRQAKSLTLESVLSCMDRIGDAIVEIKRGADRRTSAEMAVIRLTSPKLDTDTAAVLRRISDIEVKLKNGVFKPSPESRESDFAANASPVKQSEPNEAQTQQVKNEKPESKDAVSDKTPAAYDEPNNAEPKANETSQDKNREIKSDEVFENWAEVVDILSRTSPALTGFLNGSTAFVHPGGFLLIKSSNSILGQMLMTGNFSNDIVKAVYEVSGKKYRIGIYNDEHSEAKPKKDPLDGLLSRAKELGINVIDQ